MGKQTKKSIKRHLDKLYVTDTKNLDALMDTILYWEIKLGLIMIEDFKNEML